MTTQEPARHLGKILHQLLQKGFTMDKGVMQYIDSTFSNPSADEFTRILSDPLDCEAETVLELILFPDTEIQQKIESIIKTENYDKTDVESVVRYLLKQKICVPVCFADQRGMLRLCPTDSCIRQFVNRLNLAKQINKQLDQALSRYVSDASEELRLRVMLRNCRAEFVGEVCSFLCQCIEKMYSKSD